MDELQRGAPGDALEIQCLGCSVYRRDCQLIEARIEGVWRRGYFCPTCHALISYHFEDGPSGSSDRQAEKGETSESIDVFDREEEQKMQAGPWVIRFF